MISSDRIRGGIERKKEMFTSDPCDSDSVELMIAILSLFTLEWKVPYTSDSDSTSDSIASVNQPIFKLKVVSYLYCSCFP